MTQSTNRSDRVVDFTLVPVVLLATLALFAGFLPLGSGVFWALVVPSVVLLAVALLLVARSRRRPVDVVDVVADAAR